MLLLKLLLPLFACLCEDVDDYGLPWEESTPADNVPLIPPKYKSFEFVDPRFYASPVVLNLEFEIPPKPPKITLEKVEEAVQHSPIDKGIDQQKQEERVDGPDPAPSKNLRCPLRPTIPVRTKVHVA